MSASQIKKSATKTVIMSFNHRRSKANRLTLYSMGLGSMFLLSAVTSSFKVLASQPSPLEIEVSNRPSTQAEKQMTAKIADLHQQAQTSLDNNQSDRAFKLWYQALRLQQQLNTPAAEVKQLGRVGAVAWQQNRIQDLKIITQRLRAIETSLDDSPSIELLLALNNAYLQVQNIDRALEICQQILAHARSEEDKSAQTATLKEIGSLHLSRFDYLAAGPIYQKLLATAQTESDKIAYLQTLKDIYDRSLQPAEAIAVKQELYQYYQKNQQMQLLPALKLAIASDYEALDQIESANLEYQTAFELAWSQQQLAVAAEALSKLGSLYNSHEENDYALQVYSELIKIQQRTYDHYGLMSTYDRIAQIHRQQQNYDQALYILQQALEIAESLDHRQQYFADQIQRLR